MKCRVNSSFYSYLTYKYRYYYTFVIERKTYRADIDRRRPKIFMLSFLATTAFFLLVLNIRWTNPIDSILDSAIDDVSVDLDMLPTLEPPEKNIVAAIHHEQKATDRINKVDEVLEQKKLEEVKNNIKFTPSEAGDAEEMKEEEKEAIVPAVVSMNGEQLPLRVIEELPEFPGGMEEFVRWLSTALKYPSVARSKRIQGTVMVSFVVEKDGSIKRFKIEKFADSMLNAEAMRVMRMMPKWKPATDHGRPVRSVVAIPIVFAL